MFEKKAGVSSKTVPVVFLFKIDLFNLLRCRQRARVAGIVIDTVSVQTYSRHSVVFLGKTLYGTCFCLVVLARLLVISLLNYKRKAISWYLRMQAGVIACPIY